MKTILKLLTTFIVIEDQYPCTILASSTQPKGHKTCCKLSILPACSNLSTSYNKLVNFTKLQQVCYKLLKNCNKPVDKKFGQSTCNKSVGNRFLTNKLSQAMPTHPDIGLL